MIDLTRTFHIGISVPDIAAAQAAMTEAMGLAWAPVRVFDPLPFWTPAAGSHEVLVHATYSKNGPHHLELVQGTGAFYDPARDPDARHIGVWTDDLSAEVERLIGLGWKVEAAGAPPEEGYGLITYLAAPVGGLLVELVSTALKPVIDEWMAG